MSDDNLPISAARARAIFAPWKAMPAVVLAVSGGPDSVALMWLAARWRSRLKCGPRLIAVTVDHGLRQEAAREAREVRRLARTLGIEHRTLRWQGAKPKTGLPAAAREARRIVSGRCAMTMRVILSSAIALLTRASSSVSRCAVPSSSTRSFGWR